jgi:hypothetical protein
VSKEKPMKVLLILIVKTDHECIECMCAWLLLSEKYKKEDLCVIRQYSARIKSEEDLLCVKYKALICLIVF